MAKELPTADTFSVDLQWPANPGNGGDSLLDESIARLQMMVGHTSITSFQTEKGDKSSYLHIPVYFLVEWLALNWWSFLYEPRKFESEEAERDYRSRHWLGTARNGIALPDVMFSPAGNKIEIVARSAYLRFAQLNFIESVVANLPTEVVRSEFSAFIEKVLSRLREKGIRTSPAQEGWNRVKETSDDEEIYCRLIGSLGLSPYIAHPEIDYRLEQISGKISASMLIDLCDAANIMNFIRTAELTENISRSLAMAKPVRLHPLLAATRPLDATPRAYEWGYRAADAARTKLGIAHDDPAGANRFFEKIQFDPTENVDNTQDTAGMSLISGAAVREEEDMRLSLVGANRAHRKFAAGRASFLAWSRSSICSRLVTTARTRDQQASRAFAAELLAPAKYLKKRLGDYSDVSPFALDEISEEMGISPTLVHYQAKNNGYYITEELLD